MDSQRFYALRFDIQKDALTVDGMMSLIYNIVEKVGRKPSYLFMSESDIKVLASDTSLGYIPDTPNSIMGVYLVPLPGLECNAVIAGFFAL